MGVDIYLNSVWEPWFAEFEAKDKGEEILGHITSSDEATRAINELFEVYRSSGGYFRNAYNGTDVMVAMGLSWDTVSPLLDAEQRLPIERARELLAMILARPIEREQFARHLASYGNGPVQRFMDEAIGRPPPVAWKFDLDEMLTFVCERRAQLIAILRKSIALDEPLLCQL
jgi:hypothetical protein